VFFDVTCDLHLILKSSHSLVLNNHNIIPYGIISLLHDEKIRWYPFRKEINHITSIIAIAHRESFN
jgi:hypothetical protein